MNVISMIREVIKVANAMIRESALPDFAFPTEDASECMRIAAFDQLNGMLERDVVCGSEQKMDMLRHHDELVNFKPAFAPVAIKSLQEKADIVLDHEQAATFAKSKT